MIAAALVGVHLKLAAGEGGGGTAAAEMDEGGEILPLARSWLHIAGAGENVSDVAVQIHRSQLDGMARDRADIEARKAAAAIRDRVVADAEPRGLGIGAIGHLGEADGRGGGLVDRE